MVIRKLNILQPILIIGGGISGITTAVEAAETGYEVILIEKLPYLGGRVVKMNQYFPKLCPPYCGLEINFSRIRRNNNIQILTSSTIINISGEKGNYKVKVKSAPKYVNDNCTSCGQCVNVCPVERKNEFNYGLNSIKAIYLPHEMAFPYKYNIDETVCEKENCKKCMEVCEYDAIDFSAKEVIHEFSVSSIVIATGWRPYEAEKLHKLGYSIFKNIITNVEMERLAAPNGIENGKIRRLSDKEIPKKIAFIQCAGSRDENHLPYCSGVCCSASLKQALNYTEKVKDGKATIFYIDLRVTGRNEDFLKKGEKNQNINLIKGKATNIIETENNNLIVEAEDIMSGRKIKEEFEMVILATGIVPEKIDLDIIDVDEFGFVKMNKANQGIISVACAREPTDVSTSLKEATGAALLAIQIANNS